MKRSALLATTTAVVALTGAAAPASAETLSLGAGYSDRYGDLTAEGRTSWSVQVFQSQGGAWRARVHHQVVRQDPATGAFRTTTRQSPGLLAHALPAGAVTVSPNEHVITVSDVEVPADTVVQTSSTSGASRTVTPGSTVLRGTFRLAGGNTQGFVASGTQTPQSGCDSAQHYEDTVRRAVTEVHVLGADLVVEAGAGRSRTASATLSSYRIRGTGSC